MRKRAFIRAYMKQYGGTIRHARRIYRHASNDFIQLVVNA